MADFEKDMQELKKEVVESRNLVIKTDNLLKNLHAEMKLVAKKQETFERRSYITSATAYILFMAISSLGAYMYARSEGKQLNMQLQEETTRRTAAVEALKTRQSSDEAILAERKRADGLFDRLSSSEAEVRNAAITEVAALDETKTLLSKLEIKGLYDKAESLRQAAANDALEAGRAAFNRRDFKTAAAELERHRTLAPTKPDDVALLLLGQARHALREFKEAVDPLQSFLKAKPGSANADYVTLILGEALTEAGETARAIEVYRTGADKYYQSQYSPWMRTRARKLEQAAKETPPAPVPGGAPATTPPAPTAATGAAQ